MYTVIVKNQQVWANSISGGFRKIFYVSEAVENASCAGDKIVIQTKTRSIVWNPETGSYTPYSRK